MRRQGEDTPIGICWLSRNKQIPTRPAYIKVLIQTEYHVQKNYQVMGKFASITPSKLPLLPWVNSMMNIGPWLLLVKSNYSCVISLAVISVDTCLISFKVSNLLRRHVKTNNFCRFYEFICYLLSHFNYLFIIYTIENANKHSSSRWYLQLIPDYKRFVTLFKFTVFFKLKFTTNTHTKKSNVADFSRIAYSEVMFSNLHCCKLWYRLVLVLNYYLLVK